MPLSRLRLVLLVLLVPYVLGAGGGEGEGAKSSGPQVSEYLEKTSRLNGLKEQIPSLKTEIKDLIRQKKATKDPKAQAEIIEQLVERHKELLAKVRDYNKVRAELAYRFPKKGDTLERQYMPMRETTIDEIEEEMGFDAHMTRVKLNVDNKYRQFVVPPGEKDKIPKKKKKKKKKEERLKLVR